MSDAMDFFGGEEELFPSWGVVDGFGWEAETKPRRKGGDVKDAMGVMVSRRELDLALVLGMVEEGSEAGSGG